MVPVLPPPLAAGTTVVLTPVMLFFSLRPSSLAGTLTSRLAFLVRLPVSVVESPGGGFPDCCCCWFDVRSVLLHGVEV